MSRATVSDGPPAWNGATMVTKRVGKSWACARDVQSIGPTAADARASNNVDARWSDILVTAVSRATVPQNPRLHFEDVHVARGLLVPYVAEAGTYPAPHRLGDGFRITPADARHRFERLDRGVIGDLLDPASRGGGFRDAGQHHRRIRRQVAALVESERHRHHPGEAEPAAIGDGALLGTDQEGAVLVEAAGPHPTRSSGPPGARAAAIRRRGSRPLSRLPPAGRARHARPYATAPRAPE